jgi:hypothetical protein
MNFLQNKLTRKEWESIEMPISLEEANIIRFINLCYETKDFSKSENVIFSLSKFLKLSDDKHEYLYQTFFEKEIQDLQKLFSMKELSTLYKEKKKATIKTKDFIRINSVTDKHSLSVVYEFLLIKYMKEVLTSSDTALTHSSLYALSKLLCLEIDFTNPFLKATINEMYQSILQEKKVSDFVWFAKNVIEKNSILMLSEPRRLYQHQKDLFQAFQNPYFEQKQAIFLQEDDKIELYHPPFQPKLCFYVAPTGTGKTLSPLALCNQYRVIFVCAARHVGLELARCAISLNKKVAFAFGCEDTSDIRLHNSSAVIFETDYRSGAIRKIDHSVGTKVEIMISDLGSYLCAMWYMKTFNHVENILVFWDEPTISLDVTSHPFHDIIHRNWNQNSIPNIVLSSATLPPLSQLEPFQHHLRRKFENIDIFAVHSADFKKTIRVLNTRGFIEMPHFICQTFEEVVNVVNHLSSKKSLLRYLDLQCILSFLHTVEKLKYVPQSFYVENIFLDISMVQTETIKLHYLEVLLNIKSGCWGSLFLHLQSEREQMFQEKVDDDTWGVYLSTKDASTLTDGPTLFLSHNTDKIGKFLIQQSKIPKQVLDTISKNIEENNRIFVKLEMCEKALQKTRDNGRDGVKKGDGIKKKDGDEKEATLKGYQVKAQRDYELLKSNIKKVELAEMYTPNKPMHLELWKPTNTVSSCFCGDIEPIVLEEIMALQNVSDDCKLLLLMGIGVFSEKVGNDYLEIVKTLVSKQKLYLVIANSDYIYGTNYQFTHAYLSKDLCLTQEKLIQCIGRVGRNNIQHCYTVRFRDNAYSRLLFFSQEENVLEIENINRIFS